MKDDQSLERDIYTIISDVDHEYQVRNGNYGVFIKAIFRLLVVYLQYLISSKPRTKP